MRAVQYGLLLAVQTVLVGVLVAAISGGSTSATATDVPAGTEIPTLVDTVPGVTGDPTNPTVNGKPVSEHLLDVAEVLDQVSRR